MSLRDEPRSFSSDLAAANAGGDLPEWCEAYRRAWPDCLEILDRTDPGPHQRWGIDRVVILANGTSITIDEKLRSEDWDDQLIEVWGDLRSHKLGWALDPEKKCRYFANLFMPSKRCTLLPADELRRAWHLHGRDWWDKATSGMPGGWLRQPGRRWRKGRDGFGVLRSQTAEDGRHWTTVCITVPTDVLFAALGSVNTISWADQ